MAIESSNRSPSPMSIRQNPNPNPNFANSRNQAEKRGDGGVRRSANGSPFPKPAVVAHPTPWSFSPKTTSGNSPAPADNARRSSFSKEPATMGLSRDMNEHKENKQPNPNLNSNSKALRGSKNFMSPTISAVSKATPSPRKKALAERNEAVRTSASLSDGKFLFFAAALEDDLKGEPENCEFQKEIRKKEENPHVSTCGAKKRVTFDDDVVVLSPEVHASSDADEPFESLFVSEMMKPNEFSEIEQKEPSLNICKPIDFVSSPPSPIAPLDADPSVPSYDPNTNFLSPRPQFLRYNPRRKDTLYLDTDQPKNLEDTLSSETFSDNDMESSTAEEVQSEEVSVQEEEFVGSSSSVVEEVKIESSDDSTDEDADEEEIAVESEILAHQQEETCSVVSETALKPRSFTIWRAITWLALFGAVAFLASMVASNDAAESVMSKIYQTNHPLYEFVKADFSGSLQNMRKWSATYLPLMMSSFRESDMIPPSQFHNFSEMVCDANDHFVEHKTLGFPLHPVVESHPEPSLEEVEVKSSPQFEEAELPNPGVQSQQVIEDVAPEQLVNEDVVSKQPVIEDVAPEPPVIEDVATETPVIEDVVSEQPVIEDVASEPPVIEDVATEAPVIEDVDSEHLAMQPVIEDVVSEQSVSEDVSPQQIQVIEQTESNNEVFLDALEEPSPDDNVVQPGQAEAVMLESPTIEGSAGNQQVMGGQGVVAFVVASLCVATALSIAIIAKSKKADKTPTSTTARQAKMLSVKGNSFNGNPSHGSQMEAVDMDAEAYDQSEMSSYSFYDKPVARGSESEAQSKERKQQQQSRRNYKRESLASSSSEYTMGSTSYGSFTTYSILPTKNGDEEYVTPVRRSSRIRKNM